MGVIGLLLLAILVFVLCKQRRKVQERKDDMRRYSQRQLGLRLDNEEMKEGRRPRQGLTNTGSDNTHPPDEAARTTYTTFSRTLTKTNGSLKSKDTLDDDSEIDDGTMSEDEGEVEVSSFDERGNDNRAYTASPDSSFHDYQVNQRQSLPPRVDNNKSSTYSSPVHSSHTHTRSHISDDSRLNEVGIPQTYAALTRERLRQSQPQPRDKNQNVEMVPQQRSLNNKPPPRQYTNPPNPYNSVPIINTASGTSQKKAPPPTAPKPRPRASQRQEVYSVPMMTRVASTSSCSDSSMTSLQPETSSAATPGNVGQQPFNYIAFSQMLYGEHPEEEKSKEKARAVSFV